VLPGGRCSSVSPKGIMGIHINIDPRDSSPRQQLCGGEPLTGDLSRLIMLPDSMCCATFWYQASQAWTRFGQVSARSGVKRNDGFASGTLHAA